MFVYFSLFPCKTLALGLKSWDGEFRRTTDLQPVKAPPHHTPRKMGGGGEKCHRRVDITSDTVFPRSAINWLINISSLNWRCQISIRLHSSVYHTCAARASAVTCRYRCVRSNYLLFSSLVMDGGRRVIIPHRSCKKKNEKIKIR